MAYLRLVDVIVVTLVGSTDDHDSEVLARVDAEVIHGRLEEMAVLCEPFGKVERRSDGHGGRR